jgi:hypothetical protein
MSTSPYPLYQPYQPVNYNTATPYKTSSNPNQIAANEVSGIQQTGTDLENADEQLANQYLQAQSGTQGYLAPIEAQNASGQGGYTPAEASQITLSPAQQQAIVTNAGISAGQGTAAATGAAERATSAAGGSPAAMATNRLRAAQQSGVQAGNAETGASVAAQQAASQGAQTVGNARLAEQNQGLGELSSLQAEQGQQGQNEQGMAGQAFGTTTSGTTAASNTGLAASQTPSTFDKTIGAVSGALGALADGKTGYLEDGMEAVLGEDGPEVIVSHASDPVRSNTHFMEDGGLPGRNVNPPSSSGMMQGGEDYMADGVPYLDNGDYGGETNNPATPVTPAPVNNGDYGGETNSPASPGVSGPVNWLQRYLAAKQTPAPQTVQPQWTKETPYSQLGAGLGNLARTVHLADGFRSRTGVAPLANGVTLVNKPTRMSLQPGDSVVPLTYRPKAKVRPSVAASALRVA